MTTKKALVVGASGGIGQNLVHYLSEQKDWEIVGLSRSKPRLDSTAQFIAIDLLNRDDVVTKLETLTDITHIFYTAFYGGPTFSGPVAENLAMLTGWDNGEIRQKMIADRRVNALDKQGQTKLHQATRYTNVVRYRDVRNCTGL